MLFLFYYFTILSQKKPGLVQVLEEQTAGLLADKAEKDLKA